MGIASAGRVVVNVLGLAALILLTRALGPEDFGRYSAIYAYLYFVAIAADMGLGVLLTREISRPGANEARIVGTLFTFRFTLVLGVTIIAGALSFLFPYESVVKVGILIGSIAIIAQSLVQALMGVFQKHLRISIPAVADIITRLVQLAGIFLLVTKGRAFLIPILLVNVLAEAVHLIIIFKAARRIVPFDISFDLPYWRNILGSAAPIAASLLFTLLYFKIDTIMLSFMRSPYEVGVYSLAYKVLEMAIFFPAMYVGLVMPFLSQSASKPETFRTILKHASAILAIGAAASVAVLLLFAGPIVRLIGGADFHGAIPALRILGLAVGIIFFGNLGGHAIIALNLQLRGMWIYLGAAIFNIVTNALLIPRYGYLAASWTTVATELLVTVVMLLFIRLELRKKDLFADRERVETPVL